VRIFVGIKNVRDRVFADRKHQPIRGLRARELVLIGAYFLGRTKAL
jgi:hypothetical protein